MKSSKIFLVGGAVRDHLLGIASKDRDYVVVGSSPEKLLAEGFTQVGASFPVFLHPVTGDEYALARTERKTGPGYHGFDTVYDSSVTLEDDLARRDLTINSIAMTDNFQIIDPFHGVEDLQAGILRHTSEAFADDPLRVLRLARFAARYGFSVAPETMELAKKLVQSGELDALPRERIWTELYKGFSEKDPSLMLMVLKQAGAFDVSPLIDYFGSKFDVDAALHLMKVVESSNTKSNKTDAKAVIAMSAVESFSHLVITSSLKVPNHIRDALILERSFTSALTKDLTAENVAELFKTTRFVTDFDSETMQLALFVSSMRSAVFMQTVVHWVKNLNKLKAVASAIKRLDMAAIVASGDMKTVKSRVEAAKFAVIKRRFK